MAVSRSAAPYIQNMILSGNVETRQKISGLQIMPAVQAYIPGRTFCVTLYVVVLGSG
jgi:hypothetical protein